MELLKSFLNTTTDVVIVVNDTLPDKPIITPLRDAQGNPKTDMLGNELGSIRLEQKNRTLNGSFLNSRNRVAFIGGTIEQLQAILKENNLVAGSKLPGKIIVTESLTEMWPKQTSKINPQTQEAIGVRVNDKFFPVFMKMTYTEDMNAKDTFIRTPEDVITRLQATQIAQATANTGAPADTAAVPATTGN